MKMAVPTFMLEAANRLVQAGAAQPINLAQQAAHFGESWVKAFGEIAYVALVEREAALLQRRIGFDVDRGYELGAAYAFDQQEELLRAVYIYVFMKGTRLACVVEDFDINATLQLVIECLELELELCSIRHTETVLVWQLAIVARYGGSPGAKQFHVVCWCAKQKQTSAVVFGTQVGEACTPRTNH